MRKRKQMRFAVNVEEAAKLLGIGRTLAYQASQDGRIPTVRFGTRRIVPLRALEEKLVELANQRKAEEE